MLRDYKKDNVNDSCYCLVLKRVSLVLFALNLLGCTAVATQVASSILTHSADKIINNAYEAKLREEDKNRKLPDTHPDIYWLAMQNAGFNTITPQVEGLPTPSSSTFEPEQPKIIIEPLPIVAQLATVEVWNLVVGTDKNKVFENARLHGASQLPPQPEWENWQVGLGELIAVGDANSTIKNIGGNTGDVPKKQTVTFLIPPELGRISSGQQLVIELAVQGEVNIARYAIDNKTAVSKQSF